MDWSQSGSTESSRKPNEFHCVTFLSVAQQLQLDFLPVSWHQGLQILGVGETTQVNQSIVTVERSFAFKRRPKRTNRTDAEFLEALCTEATILRHQPIREDNNIVDVLGCLWESDATGENNWPILVFPKADHGSLQAFLNSDEGRKTTIDTKLKLCCDIIGAVQKLHACNVVHGDLKPENFLIFQDSNFGFIAKVADFGFSCFGENENDKVQPPKSEPWAGPEWHHRGFFIKHAKLLDIFSLGMVCLWTMMEHVSHRSTLPDVRTTAGDCSASFFPKQSSISALHHWKDQRSLPKLAFEVVESLQELSESEKSGLVLLFDQALQHNPAKREVNITKLAEGVRFHRRANSAGLEMCSSTKSLNHQHFRLVTVLPQLSLVSYQVRLKILRALESALRLWDTDENCFCCQPCSENIAFQLALALHIGLAGFQQDTESKKWLKRSSRSFQDLEKEIEELREGGVILEYTGEFERLKNNGLIHLSDFTEQYSHPCSNSLFEKACRREVVAFTGVLGDSHFMTIMLKQVLASIYKGKLAYAEALHLEQECLETLQRSEDSDNRFALKVMLRLGSTYCQLGKYHEALELQDKARCLTKEIFGDEHPTTLSAAANLACTYWEMGEWARAESEFLHLSEKIERVFGLYHPETLSSKANAAMAQKMLGKLDKSLILEESITKQCIQTLGPENTMTWRIVSNLAQTYMAQNQFDEAEKVLKSLSLPREEAWAEMPVDKLRILNVLALVYSSQRRFDDARYILDRNIKNLKEILGLDHVDTIKTSLILAKLAYDEGEREYSMSILEEIFEDYTGLTAKTGDSLPSSIEIELVQLCKLLALWDKAAPLQYQIVSSRRKVLGLDHTQALEAIASLCETLANQGKYKEADEFEYLINEDRLNTIQDKDSATAILAPLAKVGSIYLDQDGELDHAQRILEKVCISASRILGQAHLIALNALGNLASAYALNNMPAKAYNAYLKVTRIKTEAFGSDDPSTLTTLANFKYFCECIGIEADFTMQALES